MNKRLYLDVSSLARWTGPPVGMIRVESEVAKASTAIAHAALVVYDRRDHSHRRLDSRWEAVVTGSEGIIDPWNYDHFDTRSGFRRWLPTRHPVVQMLERLRLHTSSKRVFGLLDRLQRLVLSLRPHHFQGIDANGRRTALVPSDMALGPALVFDENDTLFVLASDWARNDIEVLSAKKAKFNFKIALICHDLIPLTHPIFFQPETAAVFEKYWRSMLSISDTLIVTSEAIRLDVENYCLACEIAAPIMTVVALGHPSPLKQSLSMTDLPDGLEAGKFVLYVSTIEPRKNHSMLIRVWHRLMSEPSIANANFKIVFVGRRGWMVDDLLDYLNSFQSAQSGIIHMTGIHDALLQTLYQNSAFCVYPSLYEGYGLPVVEAMSYGRATISSNGGSLTEISAGLVPVLDPHDDDAWFAMMKDWILDPASRQRHEEIIRRNYPHRPWSLAAAAIIAAVDDDQIESKIMRDAP